MTDVDPDAHLVEALRGRDARARRDAEHALFERFRAPVERIMRRMLGDDSDDCVQEALVDVFRGLRTFEGRSRLSTWIYRVALRRAWKCAATRKRRERGRVDGDELVVRATSAAADAPTRLAASELAQRFGVALQRLDLDQRTVMSLSALEGLGPTEIAEVLGVPVGTVHSRTSRARERLRKLLGIRGDSP
jgi:RNA polymerase sigma-70 factor (ECF subfamily)